MLRSDHHLLLLFFFSVPLARIFYMLNDVCITTFIIYNIHLVFFFLFCFLIFISFFYSFVVFMWEIQWLWLLTFVFPCLGRWEIMDETYSNKNPGHFFSKWGILLLCLVLLLHINIVLYCVVLCCAFSLYINFHVTNWCNYF